MKRLLVYGIIFITEKREGDKAVYDFFKIISQFKIDGKLNSCERYGEGHINETYLAEVEKDGVKTNFILQKINNKLFKNVPALMENIRSVTEFNRAKIIEKGGNPDRESLSIVYTKDEKPFFFDSESVFIFVSIFSNNS